MAEDNPPEPAATDDPINGDVLEDVKLEDEDESAAKAERAKGWRPSLFGGGKGDSDNSGPSSSAADPPKRSSSPIKVEVRDDSTQSDIIKETMIKSAEKHKKKIKPGARIGGIFGTADWSGESEMDMNLAFKGYKRSSIVGENADNSSTNFKTKDQLESLAQATDGGIIRDSLTSGRSSESSDAAPRFRLSFWPSGGGSGISTGETDDGDKNPLSSSVRSDSTSKKPPRISFWPGLEEDEEKKRISNASTISSRSSETSTSLRSSSRASRISTIRKRDSRSPKRRTATFNTTENGDMSRESWSHMRDSLNPNLFGSGVSGSDEDQTKNQAKFLESAIKAQKKQSIFGNWFGAGGGGGGDNAGVLDPDLVEGDDEDINKTLRRITQHNAKSMDQAREEISKMKIYDSMLEDDE